MNKEKYDAVELEIVSFETEDVIVTSYTPVCAETGPLVG